MTNFVTIIGISAERQDKNNRTFKLVTLESPGFREVADPSTGEIFVVRAAPKRTSIAAYEKQYLDDNPHYLYSTPVHAKVFGNVITKSVEAYEIDTKEGPKTVGRYTTFVEAGTDETDFEERIAKAFENAGHQIVAARVATTPAPVASEDVDATDIEVKQPELVLSEEDELEDEF